jgi:hypothetical protein
VAEDWYFEGAWDGNFEEGGFPEATAVVGTGGRITPEGPVFTAPTDMYQHLTSIRRGDNLYLSNSLVFTFVLAGDKPDIDYPYAIFDILQASRWGLRKPETRIRTYSKSRITLHKFGNVRIGPGLETIWEPREDPPPPLDYESYTRSLTDALRKLFENGSASARRRPLTPLTTISAGYDSAAVSALAARAGCSEAVTITLGQDDDRDNGRDIAGYLNLEVKEIQKLEYLRMPGFPEAEFCAAGGLRQNVMFISMEDDLAGRILLLGRPGDSVWEGNELFNFSGIFSPLNTNLGSTPFCEFRLRLGFVCWSVPYFAYAHISRLFEISSSREMRPWHVPGDYNRPIPRRILESAGVPREMFGQEKMANAHVSLEDPPQINRNSREEFFRFYRTTEIPKWFPAKPLRRPADVFYLFLDMLFFATKRLPGKDKRPFKLLAPFLMLSDRRRVDWRYKLKYLYLFHWGFEKIRERYVFR